MNQQTKGQIISEALFLILPKNNEKFALATREFRSFFGRIKIKRNPPRLTDFYHSMEKLSHIGPKFQFEILEIQVFIKL